MALKLIPIHGIEFTEEIIIPIKIDNKYYNDIQFISYKRYLKEIVSDKTRFPKADKIRVCDTVAVYNTQCHNTFEVINIKIILAIIYFSDRMANTKFLEANYINELFRGENRKDIIEGKLYDSSDEFFKNYLIYGYRDNNNQIKNTMWYITLGNKEVTNDNFDNLLTRVFEDEIEEEESRQINFIPSKNKINIDQNFLDTLNLLLHKVNNIDLYSSKIKSALRLFYDVMYHENLDKAIINYSTILETLLLGKDESNQRKKVSVRSALIIANAQNRKRKEFIANTIYYFYKYRNNIIHDGLLSLEIDHEVIINNILSHVRNIIYFIIKSIIELDIKSIDGIKQIVSTNRNQDNISNSFDYITYSDEEGNLELIFQED